MRGACLLVRAAVAPSPILNILPPSPPSPAPLTSPLPCWVEGVSLPPSTPTARLSYPAAFRRSHAGFWVWAGCPAGPSGPGCALKHALACAHATRAHMSTRAHERALACAHATLARAQAQMLVHGIARRSRPLRCVRGRAGEHRARRHGGPHTQRHGGPHTQRHGGPHTHRGTEAHTHREACWAQAQSNTDRARKRASACPQGRTGQDRAQCSTCQRTVSHS